ncbi:hypothetical protein NEOLEDRAFT_1182055 [Neolentinus lepideus HHB14362 ss-1]|uniref:ATP synthase subunit 4 n=1 Tax=Neolentinus lepideus HHB14362 ss-1 TaxID=1314782 RepID=A0A165PFR5_9AGAM|nr:hypothetical protein NEOLEDRAFT_1182055 [Neolentinus lepideus HHB14362 ss-1]
MASRIAVQSLRASASKVRPQAVARVMQTRTMASGSNPPPAEKASEIINNLPSSPNLITKTGTILLGTGALATAISQELYVLNEETVIAAGALIMFTAIAKSIGGPYREWAEGHIARVRTILEGARAEHTQAVKDRISSVERMKDVVSITEGLFELSKETAKLEADTFVQQQKVILAAEAKAVLDSWVRFEQQQKENEQAELAKSVIDKVMRDLSNERTQREILVNALAEVEQLVKSKAI